MREKVSEAWQSFKWFCATQAQNFYIGLTISALAFLSLFSSLPIVTSAALCPLLSVAAYVPLRFVCGGSLEWKGDYGLKNSIAAVLIASLYLLILVFI